MVTNKFTRESRLLTPSQFKSVFTQPTRYSSRHFTLLVIANNQSNNRLGLAIAKKRVKLAVQRNRIKRIIRESFRQNTKLPDIDVVVMVKSGIDELENKDIQHQLNGLWRKIIQRHKK